MSRPGGAPPAGTGPVTIVPDGDRVPVAFAHLKAVGETRRRARRLTTADRSSATILGVGFVAIAIGAAAQVRSLAPTQLFMAAALVAVYALAYRTEFVSVSGATVPTQPVLVAMFFLLPVPAVPLVVLLGLAVGGGMPTEAGGRLHASLVRAVSGWHCVGPLVVLSIAGVHQATPDRWPVLVLALAAQFACDAASGLARAASLGVSIGQVARPMLWTFSVDALLTPVGAGAALMAGGTPWALLFVICPIVLVRMLAHDRTEHLEQAVTLAEAYEVANGEARVDRLTGLANRRAWDEAIDGIVAGRRDGTLPDALVVMADLDRLKHANDTFGHDIGDALLGGVADALRRSVPSDAIIARIGGDEFAVALAGERDELDGPALLTAIRVAIAAHQPAGPVPLSASLGAARYSDHRTIGDAIRAADEACAADKAARRLNRVA